MTLHRRRFLGAAAFLTAGIRLGSGGPRPAQGSDVVVVGAGTFGIWTALHLNRLGAPTTVVDAYGAGNSRASSGGETRGVRSAYGDRPHGRLWTRWATESMRRWREWDDTHVDPRLPRLFYQTGDLILRPERVPYLEDSAANWDALGVPYEFLTMDEVGYRWPWIRTEGMGVALYEPGAGVVRARAAIASVAGVFGDEGGTLTLGRAELGLRQGRVLQAVRLENGETLRAETFVFACGPWLPKVFPQLMGRRLRIPLGHVYYFATPPGDQRWVYPNMPSYGIPGVTGWPALGADHRGFRVRTGGRPPEDPDLSQRWIEQRFHEQPRRVLEERFPDLAGAPITETRACHYDLTVGGNFIIDRHPDFDNVWLAGGGSTEAFKSGPVIGEYTARRVLGIEDDPDLAEGFRLSADEFEEP
jgi:sarcosine oxidase